MFERDDWPYCHRMKSTGEAQDYFRGHLLIFSVATQGYP
jgi:hypothetical protein